MANTTVPAPISGRIGRSLVLYRAEEHRVLELLKNLALGRVFQHMQASFRRKMGRVYRRLLATAKTALGGALRAVQAAHTIGPAELAQMDAFVDIVVKRMVASTRSEWSSDALG